MEEHFNTAAAAAAEAEDSNLEPSYVATCVCVDGGADSKRVQFAAHMFHSPCVVSQLRPPTKIFLQIERKDVQMTVIT